MNFGRIHKLLLPEEKRKGMKVVLSIFCTALLDFVSLASLLPILYYLLEGGENKKAALYFSLIAGGVIIIKSIVSVFFERFQTTYLLNLYKRLSTALFETYYKNGLLYIKEHGYSSLGHAINYMCYIFCIGFLLPSMRMAAESVLVLLITVALFIYDWYTALVLYASIIPLMAAYVLFVRKKVVRFGKEEAKAKREQARIVMDTFRGYQELEINDAFEVQKTSFEAGMERICTNRTKLETMQKFPLFISECAVIISLAILVVTAGADAKMTVGIFAVSAFRLLPSLRGMVNAYTQIQNNMPSLDTVEESITDKEVKECSGNQSVITFNNCISIKDLVFNYGEQEIIFKDFTIGRGEYVGFCGYSGVGKTTLFNLLLGFLKPASGRIAIDGIELDSENRRQWLKYVGYVPQEVFIFNGSIAENIALGYTSADRKKVASLLKMVSLDSWVDSLPCGIDSTLGEGGSKLSGGQKQRIGIARALYKGAEILLLDEATSALDNATEKEINTMLKKLKGEVPGLTILSIAHRESSLAYCSRIINLEEDGKENI